jgi:hypothetical protein
MLLLSAWSIDRFKQDTDTVQDLALDSSFLQSFAKNGITYTVTLTVTPANGSATTVNLKLTWVPPPFCFCLLCHSVLSLCILLLMGEI